MSVGLRVRTLGLANAHRPRLGFGGINRGKGKLVEMTEDAARKLFEKFRKSRVGMSIFSPRQGYNADGLADVFRKFFPDEYEILQEHKRSRKDLWYKKGRAFEYATRNVLRGLGYFVLRSPQSRSPLDLVAIKPGTVLMVQCKAGGCSLGSDERVALLELCVTAGSVPIIAFRLLGHGVHFKKIEPQGFSDVQV
jgi:Holliday junction resolvase